MISVIIPLGRGSRWDNTELKYCLRSIEQHLKGYGDIFIIGELPGFVKNVVHIKSTDDDQAYWKERNIFNKIMIAVNDERVTDDFLFMNDDHFLLKSIEAIKFPYHYDGTINDEILRTEKQYKNTMENTVELFGNYKYITNWDVHCPIVYNKQRFIKAFKDVDWNKKWGYCIKSVYCIRNLVVGKQYPDLKIRDPFPMHSIKDLIAGRPYFSIDNRAREGGLPAVLDELYPNKSQYEI